jgi:transcription initiation factor TFIIIB Brf1 subunit/transcription initiation factor TFIIB
MAKVNNLTDEGRRLGSKNQVSRNTVKVEAAVLECRTSGTKVTNKQIAEMVGLTERTIRKSYYKLLKSQSKKKDSDIETPTPRIEIHRSRIINIP